MILSQKIVKPIAGANSEVFQWPNVEITSEDEERTRRLLRNVGYMSRVHVSGRTGNEYDERRLTYAYATKRVMALSGVQNRKVIFSSSALSWAPVMELAPWGTLVAKGFSPRSQGELQQEANELAGTPDAYRMYAQFINYTALSDDGGLYPCLVSDTVGTIETRADGRIRLTEVAYGPINAPLLVETRGLALSPLSAEFKLGLPATALGLRLTK